MTEIFGSTQVYKLSTGRVSIAIDIDLEIQKASMLEIRLTVILLTLILFTEMTVRYSIDGKTYRLAPVGTVEFGTGENQISLGR